METIFRLRPQSDLKSKQGKELKQAIKNLTTEEKPVPAASASQSLPAESIDEFSNLEVVKADPKDLKEDLLRKKINGLSRIECLPDGEPLTDRIRDTRNLPSATDEEKQTFTDLISHAIDETDGIYRKLREAGRSTWVDLGKLDGWFLLC